MSFYKSLLIASLFAAAANAAVCEPHDFRGAYGLSLTGTTTIGGTARPVVVVGRLVLDGNGRLDGTSSVGFTGLILGNPVTGKYEAHTDCSVAWTLQDDSGALQHFAGTMSSGGTRVAFRQTDPGGAGKGILVRSMDQCSASSFEGSFQFTASGTTIDVNTALGSGSTSHEVVLMADGARNLSTASGPDDEALALGSFEVLEDCFVKLAVELPEAEHKTATMHFRAVLVDNGREVLGIQTDPGTAVALLLISK